MKKDKLTKKQLKYYKETPEQRHDRVVAEGNRFRARTVPMKGKRHQERKELRNKTDLRHAQYN